MAIQDLSRAAGTARQLANIAKIVAGLKKVRAANTQGLQPSSNTGGGGGGAGAAPVSTLAGLPKSALLDTLVKNGLIKEGMPAEQALAVLKFAQMREGVPVDVAALMKLVSADYAKTTGDIETAGADWMKEMMGTAYDPNDPNAALFANDPTFSSYAGGLAQMGETADTNEATDLAWFRKEQEAQETYYNDMMNAISTGTLPIGAAATGGGGGGGGGGRRGGRGYGSGGGSGDGDLGFGDTKTVLKDESKVEDTRTDAFYENFPGFYTEMLNNISDPLIRDRVESLLNVSNTPEEFLAAAEEEMQSIDAESQQYQDNLASNTQFETLAGGNYEDKLNRYRELTGNVVGDNPRTEEVEQFYLPSGVDPRLPQSEAEQAEITELEEILKPSLEAATGEYGMGSPGGVSKVVNTLSYIRDLARNHIAQHPEEDAAAGTGATTLANAARNAGQAGTSAGTPTTNPTAVTSNPFQAVDPQTGGPFPGPTRLEETIWERGNPSDSTYQPGVDAPIQAGSSEWQEYLNSLNPDTVQQGPGPVPQLASEVTDRTMGGQWPGRPDAVRQPNLQQLAQIMGQSGIQRDWGSDEAGPNGGPPADLLANPAGSMPGIAELMSRQHPPQLAQLQALAQAALQNRPQENAPNPDDPASQLAAVIQAMQLGGAITSPEAQDAQRQQNIEAGVNQLEDYGYNPDAITDRTNPETGMVVNPSNIRRQYLDRILYEKPEAPSWGNPTGSTGGNLVDAVMEYMKRESEDEYAARYGDRDPEAVPPRNEGRYWVQPEMTPEEYQEEQSFVNALPDVMEMSKIFNQNINMAQTYARLQQMARESETLSGTATSYEPTAAAATATGLPNTRPFDELSPTRDLDPYVEPEPLEPDDPNQYFDSTVTLGMSGLGGAPSWGNLGNTPRSAAGNIADIMKKSAAQLNLPPTVQKPVTPVGSWSSGMKNRGTGAAGGGTRAAQGASALVRLAKVLKGFK